MGELQGELSLPARGGVPVRDFGGALGALEDAYVALALLAQPELLAGFVRAQRSRPRGLRRNDWQAENARRAKEPFDRARERIELERQAAALVQERLDVGREYGVPEEELREVATSLLTNGLQGLADYQERGVLEAAQAELKELPPAGGGTDPAGV